MLGERGVFAMRMPEIAAENEKLVVLTADLGMLSGLDRFKTLFPDRLINAGIAEQNMIGMASGLAHEGFIPFVTTYATFVSMRSCEQIRHLCCYAQNPVRIIASGAGFAMGMSGNSHYTYEDIAVMRAIPELTVLSPADGAEVYKMIDALMDYPHPVYVRLTGVLNVPIVYKNDYDFKIGKAVPLDDDAGTDLTIFATGTIVTEAVKAAKKLREEGKSIHVFNIHTIKPLDIEAVENARRVSRNIVSVEEHCTIGGLGSAIAEVLADRGNSPRLLRIGMPSCFVHPGEYKWLLERHGLTTEGILRKISEQLSL